MKNVNDFTLVETISQQILYVNDFQCLKIKNFKVGEYDEHPAE